MKVSSTFRDLGDYSVAVATKSMSKSGFVGDFLRKLPEGNVKAVNEAWAAAGMKGAIGDTLIYQTRADLGLSGQLRAKSTPKTAAKSKSPARIPKRRIVQGRRCSSRSI